MYIWHHRSFSPFCSCRTGTVCHCIFCHMSLLKGFLQYVTTVMKPPLHCFGEKHPRGDPLSRNYPLHPADRRVLYIWHETFLRFLPYVTTAMKPPPALLWWKTSPGRYSEPQLPFCIRLRVSCEVHRNGEIFSVICHMPGARFGDTPLG